MNGNETEPKNGHKDTIQKYFFLITLVIEIILGLLLIGLLVYFIMGKTTLDIYSTLGIGLIILWIGVMVAYYSWAIYFYNVNLGLTDMDWKKIEDSGNTDPSVRNRISNPEKGESLGLPVGTIRGTIALSVLIGGLALFIASLGRNNILKENQVLVDFFDFFKNAFLMMIAFYFGAKSLEMVVSPKTKAEPKVIEEPETPDTDKQDATPEKSNTGNL